VAAEGDEAAIEPCGRVAVLDEDRGFSGVGVVPVGAFREVSGVAAAKQLDAEGVGNVA
jgi:hypothetical protein